MRALRSLSGTGTTTPTAAEVPPGYPSAFDIIQETEREKDRVGRPAPEFPVKFVHTGWSTALTSSCRAAQPCKPVTLACAQGRACHAFRTEHVKPVHAGPAVAGDTPVLKHESTSVLAIEHHSCHRSSSCWRRIS